MVMEKYYRNVFVVEVLSNDEWPGITDLGEINYQIIEGHSSGLTTHVVVNEEVDKEEMARLLTAQGSEPSFLIDEEDDDE